MRNCLVLAIDNNDLTLRNPEVLCTGNLGIYTWRQANNGHQSLSCIK